eukprot:4406062-Amphidinium_carterae.1
MPQSLARYGSASRLPYEGVEGSWRRRAVGSLEEDQSLSDDRTSEASRTDSMVQPSKPCEHWLPKQTTLHGRSSTPPVV